MVQIKTDLERRKNLIKLGLGLGLSGLALTSFLKSAEALTLKPDETIFNEASAPSTPLSGKLSLYAKNTKRLYTKDSMGLEKQLNNYNDLDNAPSIPSTFTKFNAFRFFNMFDSILSGAWTPSLDYAQFFCLLVYSSAGTDKIRFKFSHDLGNYTLNILGMKHASGTDSTIYIDDISQGVMSWASPTTVRNVVNTLSISIVNNGLHTLDIEMAIPAFRVYLTVWWLTT